MFVNGVAGETIEWKYGVPQGSVLSPLLFILFIDPMVCGLKCKSSLFADDVSLWSSHDDIDTSTGSSLLSGSTMVILRLRC